MVRTLSERVYQNLRDRIVAGRLGTDVPIRQDAVAAELGMSKIPVREALARLEQVGLLVGRTNRGYVVPPMSIEDIEDIYSLRLAVEPRAAAFAVASAADADRAAAQAALELLKKAALEDAVEMATRTHNFHLALVRPGNRPLTTQLVERLLVLSARYQVAHLPRSHGGRKPRLEHESILKAWLAGDADSVTLRLAAHIDQTLQDLKRGFLRC
ncbi:MAG TPA: GntR family transcriptional regulator [Steroidobacteraceae bacterium]|nr:GntR family transcriptional regulator [Steroidobacteraceae bacterium]